MKNYNIVVFKLTPKLFEALRLKFRDLPIDCPAPTCCIQLAGSMTSILMLTLEQQHNRCFLLLIL